jgi:hypothetical protein
VVASGYSGYQWLQVVTVVTQFLCNLVIQHTSEQQVSTMLKGTQQRTS